MTSKLKRPSSTITAAGVGGLVAGVPIGNYLGGIIYGLIALNNPEAVETMLGFGVDLKAAVSGIITVLVAFTVGYFKRERVLPLRDPEAF